MKKIGLVVAVLFVVVLFSGVALADCVRDCLLTYNTCLNLCKQSGQGDSSACIEHCQEGRDGCLKRCEDQNKKSENTTNKEILVVSEINCVCAECNKKCGTGHEVWCSSYQKPKANTPIEKDIVAQYSSASASPAEEKRQEFIVEPVSAKLNNEKIETTKIILASDRILPCYAGGRIAGECPQATPYFHTFSGTCHETLEECKKMDGDMADLPGMGGCVVCGYR